MSAESSIFTLITWFTIPCTWVIPQNGIWCPTLLCQQLDLCQSKELATSTYFVYNGNDLRVFCTRPYPLLRDMLSSTRHKRIINHRFASVALTTCMKSSSADPRRYRAPTSSLPARSTSDCYHSVCCKRVNGKTIELWQQTGVVYNL